MFARVCRLCHKSAEFSVINLRRYTTSPIELENIVDADTKVSKTDKRVPIIVCKRKVFNFYAGTTYGKFDTIPLASEGWHHSKSAGDHFTIYPTFDKLETDEDVTEEQQGFEQFGLHPTLITNLAKNNVYIPTEVQKLGIPEISSGQHTILSAETGCGKTLAYLLPVLNRIIKLKLEPAFESRRPNNPIGLIITPSRELTEQIMREAKFMAHGLNIKIKCVTGGKTKRLMLNPSVADVDLLIGSFGAVSKLVSNRIYKLDYVKNLVLDEAHALFDETFDDKLEVFLRRISFTSFDITDDGNSQISCQLTLVSATQPSELPEYFKTILDTTDLKDIKTSNFHRIMVPQKFMRISGLDKAMTLLALVKPRSLQRKPFIVFSNDSPTCDWLTLFLNEFGVSAVHLNGQMPMAIRKGQFTDFQNGVYTVLSTTNAGARGLDTVNVDNVINYDMPMETAEYIHRCGRTGRMGAKGEGHVTNLITRRLEIELTKKIERAARRRRPLPILNMLQVDAKSNEGTGQKPNFIPPSQQTKRKSKPTRMRQKVKEPEA